MLLRPPYVLLIFCLLLTTRLSAQTASQPTTTWGTWHIATLLLPGSETSRFGGFAEVQARANGVFRQYFYNELKGGVSYDIDKNVTAMLAGGRYSTADYRELSAGPLNIEKRLWEQLLFNQYLDRIKFEHRYRIEQRWFTFRNGQEEFRSRIRYRLNVFVPLNARKIGPNTTFLSVYDEVFLNPRGPAFERNRLYAGLGYQLDAHWVWQAGWVNQTNYNPASFAQGQFTPIASTGKNNLVLSVIYRLNQHKGSPAEKLPSQPD
ncbi:DUF2490 domain-containing protein [Spirosoma rigui]|uniref:DUF2490 domain-containing protein n=1 Tax=Spirosoma rigui TaxID=564064 RepID=UPI0009B0215F|nr:DUF2490 domain-containing protein [Spirosoma rigui]